MSGSLREGVGKKDAKKHRAEGRVPCVIYGGEEEVHFVINEKDFTKFLFSPETFFIKMTIEGKEYNCILKDVQYHPVSDRVLHIDFLEFNGEKPITTLVPVKIVGSAPGVIKGGQLVKKFRKLTVTAMPKDMPDTINVNVGKLEINDKILINQIKLNKFTIKEKGEQFVVTVRTTRLAASAGPEEAEGEAPASEEEGAAEAAAESQA